MKKNYFIDRKEKAIFKNYKDSHEFTVDTPFEFQRIVNGSRIKSKFEKGEKLKSYCKGVNGAYIHVEKFKREFYFSNIELIQYCLPEKYKVKLWQALGCLLLIPIWFSMMAIYWTVFGIAHLAIHAYNIHKPEHWINRVIKFQQEFIEFIDIFITQYVSQVKKGGK